MHPHTLITTLSPTPTTLQKYLNPVSAANVVGTVPEIAFELRSRKVRAVICDIVDGTIPYRRLPDKSMCDTAVNDAMTGQSLVAMALDDKVTDLHRRTQSVKLGASRS